MTLPASPDRFERAVLLKRDMFGTIERGLLRRPDGSAVMVVRRDSRGGWWWLRLLARWLLRHEVRALRAAAGIDGVPRLLASTRADLLRTWIEGRPMSETPPRDPAWFEAARALLAVLHARGIAHNDLHKETNWIVVDRTTPAIVDFQLAHVTARPGRVFRTMARADLRYLLKHRTRHCPEAGACEESLARPNWVSRWWRRTFKRVYNLVTRRLLRWSDREGRGRRPA